MLRALRVSRLTICPLGQPEKAIGLEPQIELWLAFLLPPYCLSHQKPKASSRQQHESAKKENPKNRSTLHGLESWAQIFAPSSRGRAFSLDSPLYRTRCIRPRDPQRQGSSRAATGKVPTPARGSCAPNLPRVESANRFRGPDSSSSSLRNHAVCGPLSGPPSGGELCSAINFSR